MKYSVVTLNKEEFNKRCVELISKIDQQPDLVIGIQNGGGHVINYLKEVNEFKDWNFGLAKIIKDSYSLKHNAIIRFLLKRLPNVVLDKLRSYESNKVQDSIENLDLNKVSQQKLELNFSIPSGTIIRSILIIDDALDSGKTMFVVKNNLMGRFPNTEIKTAVISWTIRSSIIFPDYYIFKNVLVRFPWSLDYKGKDFE